MSNELEILRKELDGIDRQLVQLLQDRMNVSKKIGRVKRAQGQAITDSKREHLVLENVAARVADKSLENSIVSVYERIISTSKRVQRDMMNIYIIGMPTVGKSTLGKKLAKILKKDFFDTDKVIVANTGKTIPELFEQGEAFFREKEAEVLSELSLYEGAIIATGGGIITQNECVKIMKRTGVCIFLDADIESLAQNYSCKVPRPLIKTPDDIKRLYNDRIGLYRAAADLTVQRSKNTINEVIEFLRTQN